ncbi:hypothetical protein OTSSIDO_0565 [Orientia tsutsugamushi str. Sido]|nr:hypothetical protein OTSSIDO_0565 [Orientia tsutsugamushi str. Sido]
MQNLLISNNNVHMQFVEGSNVFSLQIDYMIMRIVNSKI